MSDLRDRQHEATRRQILGATQQLVVEVHGWTLSMADVAERAGVSRRTLYRYFATKEELLEAASLEWATDRDGGVDVSVGDSDGLERYLREQWRTLAENIAAVLAQHASPTGRQLRARWLQRARRMTHGHLAQLSLTDDERDELADLLLAIMSSRMFLELVDTMGHQPGRAAQLVTWAVDSLIARAQADNGMHRRADSSAE